jgi:siroheme synthase-like protein
MEPNASNPYPIALTQLRGVRCVVVGGGAVALRKVLALLNSGADVVVVSPELHPELVERHAAQALTYIARPYQHGDLAEAFLAFAATDAHAVNAAVAAEARERHILCNVADAPEASSFHTLASVQRGSVVLAATTGGDSPALAALIRRKLEQTFGPEYGVLAERLGRLRRELSSTLQPAARSRVWRALATDNVLELVRRNDPAALNRYIDLVVAELGGPDTPTSQR